MRHTTAVITALLASCPLVAQAKGPGLGYTVCRLEINRGAFQFGDELTIKATIDIERFCTQAYEENTAVGDAAECLEYFRWFVEDASGGAFLSVGAANQDWLDRVGNWNYADGLPTLSVGLSSCSKGSAQLCGSLILDDSLSGGTWRFGDLAGWDYFRGEASDWLPSGGTFQLGAVPAANASGTGPVIDDRCGSTETPRDPTDTDRDPAHTAPELGAGGCAATVPSAWAVALLSLLIGRGRRRASRV